tara:strand:- start:1446 stop:3206 length:1761 start_codon:yes stop_codon:yes gene_type:complete
MSCINPNTGIPYQIEDIGPGGGMIFSIPGQGTNNTNYYFEVALHDVSTTGRDYADLGQTSPNVYCGPSCCTGNANQGQGAEFGVYKEIILFGDNGTGIGDGLANTIHLNSYPTSWSISTLSPDNPVIDTHDLAAQLCADYVGPNGHTDWFLPSLDEFSELLLNIGPSSALGNIVNLNTSANMPASEFYWTSSALTGAGINSITTAIGVRATLFGAVIMERCTTGSVRPVRMFDCQVVPPPPIVDSYNYRDLWISNTNIGTLGSLGHVDGATGSGNAYKSIPHRRLLDGVIGMDEFIITPSLKDVNGTLYSITDFTQSASGWTISIWNLNKQFLGKWHYSTLISSNYPHNLGGGQSWPPGTLVTGAGIENGLMLHLGGVTHLAGPDPVVCYGRVAGNNNNPGNINHSFPQQLASVGGVQKTVVPEYHRGHDWFGHSFIKSVSFAYIKIETDATVAANSFNSLTGTNTNIEHMNVICAPLAINTTTFSWLLTSIIGVKHPANSGAPTVYGLPYATHHIFPWPAAHQNVPSGCTWYSDLSAAIGVCRYTGGGGISVVPPTGTEGIGLAREVDKSNIITGLNQYKGNKEE